MTRSQKISKLANAVRAYRGMYHWNSKLWIHPPQMTARNRVVKWCERLGLDVSESLNKIDAFKDLPEFWDWLNCVE